jgi:hypothetical protein
MGDVALRQLQASVPVTAASTDADPSHDRAGANQAAAWSQSRS